MPHHIPSSSIPTHTFQTMYTQPYTLAHLSHQIPHSLYCTPNPLHPHPLYPTIHPHPLHLSLFVLYTPPLTPVTLYTQLQVPHPLSSTIHLCFITRTSTDHIYSLNTLTNGPTPPPTDHHLYPRNTGLFYSRSHRSETWGHLESNRSES